MILTLELDLDMVKMHRHTKNEVSVLIALKVIARTDTYADTQTHICGRHVSKVDAHDMASLHA